MWQRNGICLVIFISLHFSKTYCSVLEIQAVKEQYALKPLETLMRSTLFKVMKMLNETKPTNFTELKKARVKRQSSGAGKYADAAKIDNLKAFRIYLTMFKNLWATPHVGGSHPLHPDVPKPVVQLFKARIMEFFFPPIGADAIKD